MRGLLAASLVALLLLAGCSSSSDESSSSTTQTSTSTSETVDHTAKSYQVSLQGNKFVNATLAIKTGDQVSWTHQDDATVGHTVTSQDSANPEQFDSHPNCVAPVPVPGVCMVSGDVFSHIFQKAGTYKIVCKVHDGMTQTITVASHNMTGMAPS